jgi:hypothetical protein
MRQKEREKKETTTIQVNYPIWSRITNDSLKIRNLFLNMKNENSNDAVAPVFSWKDLSNCFLKQDVGTTSKKRKRGQTLSYCSILLFYASYL